jgi:hypothetical protein
MTMRSGQLWECQNRACRCEILVVAPSEAKNGRNPRCCCGSPMKKSNPKIRPRARGTMSLTNARSVGARAKTHATPTRPLLAT